MFRTTKYELINVLMPNLLMSAYFKIKTKPNYYILHIEGCFFLAVVEARTI